MSWSSTSPFSNQDQSPELPTGRRAITGRHHDHPDDQQPPSNWPSARRSLFQDIEAALSSPPLSPRPMMSSDPFDLRSSNQRPSSSSAVFPPQSGGNRHFYTGTSSQFRGEPDMPMPMPMTNNGLQMQYQSVSHDFHPI
jgi:hypothetical protein